MHDDDVAPLQHVLQRIGIVGVIDEMVVDLVRDHQHMLGQAAHQRLDGRRADYRTGRIVGVAEHDQLGAFVYGMSSTASGR